MNDSHVYIYLRICMAASLSPCSSFLNGEAQYFVPQRPRKPDRNKASDIWHRNLKCNHRRKCSESSQPLKDVSWHLKLGNVDAAASDFLYKKNGVKVDEGHVKQNIGEFRSCQGSAFTLQGMGECSRRTITSLAEFQQHEKKDVRVIRHPNLSDECKQELGCFLDERGMLPPWGSGAIHQDDYSKSEESLHDSESATLDARMPDEINSCSLLSQEDEANLSRMLLNLSRANKVMSASQLYRKMENSGLKPSLHACNSLIAAFLRKGAIGDALDVFESMKKTAEPSEHTYSLVIKAIAQSQGCESALCMLKEMETRDNLKIDIIVYNTLISVCRKEHKWDRVHELWHKLKKEGCKETMVTYRLLVSTFVQCDQVELALEAYHDMIEHSWQPDGDILKGLTCVCAKEGQWMLAVDFFQQMVDLGLKPNKITYNALIDSLGKAGEVDLAFKIYEHMQKVGHSADVYTLHALLNGLNKTGQFARSLSLFEYMKTSGNFAVDTEIYNVALVSCQRLGLWEKALRYIWEMEKSGIKPGTLSYNLLISTCEVAGQPKVALQIYEHMLTVNCTPNTFTYLPLIRACGRGLIWRDIKHVLNSLPQVGVAPNASIYNTSIQALCSCGQIKLAKKFYLKMLSKGHRPDTGTSRLMLQHFPIRLKQNPKHMGSASHIN